MLQGLPGTNYTDFKRFIVGTVAVLILLLISFSAWKSVSEYRLTIRAAELQSSGYARALKEHAERTFSEADNVLLDAIEHFRVYKSIDRTTGLDLRTFISSHSRNVPQIGSMILVNREGRIFAHSQGTPIDQADVSSREYFRHHHDHPKEDAPFLSRPVKNGKTGVWSFYLSRPILSDTGAFEGVVAVAFDMKYFHGFYSSLDLGKKGRIVIVRRDGVLLMSQPFRENDFSTDFSKSHVLVTHLPRAPKGTFHISNGKALMEPTARIISYEALANFPVVTTANMGIDEVTASWRRNTFIQSAITLAACAGLYLMMMLLLRQISRIQDAYLLQAEHQNEIAASAAFWQTTFDSVADAIWVMDLERNILRCNNATESIFGSRPDQVVGSVCCAVAHANLTPLSQCPFHTMMKTGQRAVTQLGNGDKWFEVSVDPIRDASGTLTGAVHIVSDITELKRAEERAKESSSRMEALLSAIPDAIFFKDSEGKWLLANSSGIELFGLQNIDYFGKTDLELAELVPERKMALQSCRQSDQATWEQQSLTHFEENIPGADGSAHYFDTTKIPLYGTDGSPGGMVIIGRNITEQRQLEIQLRQAQKMEAIGHLAGGVAHDFNNLLTPILGYAQMSSAALPDESPLKSKMAGIISAAHKAKALTQQLLSFGSRHAKASEVIDINEIIRSFHSILLRTIRESIRIEMKLDPEGSFIKGDRTQIEQIILNMTVNSQDAFDGTQGLIHIETCKLVMDGESARMHPGMVPGEYVLLSFQDNGCGMSPDIISHIFEPFFTTKRAGHGTGLGLATVYGIVKQHDAHIAVISHEGRGTTFNIFFPGCTQVPLLTPRSPVVREQVSSGGVTILVVEDHEMVREMVQEMLEGYGFTVIAAADPNHALELLESRTSGIDLLVSDVVMPGMNGPELYEQLAVQLPSLKVVFISGYPINPSMRGGILEENFLYLQKPFTAEALIERINQVLKHPGQSETN